MSTSLKAMVTKSWPVPNLRTSANQHTLTSFNEK